MKKSKPIPVPSSVSSKAASVLTGVVVVISANTGYTVFFLFYHKKNMFGP